MARCYYNNNNNIKIIYTSLQITGNANIMTFKLIHDNHKFNCKQKYPYLSFQLCSMFAVLSCPLCFEFRREQSYLGFEIFLKLHETCYYAVIPVERNFHVVLIRMRD